MVGDVQGDGTEILRILDEDGVKITEYYWYTPDGWFYDDSYVAGWYKADETLEEETTFDRGTGIYLYVTHDKDVKLQFSGSVAKEQTEIPLYIGVNVTGNATPVSRKLQEIKLSDDAAGDGTEILRILDEDGVKVTEYYWYTPDGWFYDDSYVAGWYKADETLETTMTIAPGQGIYIYKQSSDAVSLVLPKPLVEN